MTLRPQSPPDVIVDPEQSVEPARERRIAFLIPESARDERALHAMHLLRSMIWAFKGCTRSTWILDSPDNAQVIVVLRDEEPSRTAELRATGKQVIEISTEGKVPAEPHVLVFPFRATQALELLERLDSQLLEGWPSEFTPADEWSIVHKLRRMRAHPNTRWLAGFSAGVRALWLTSNAERYFAAPETVQALQNGSLRLSELVLRDNEAPPPQMSWRPGIELAWLAAYHASADLAPWLHPLSRYRARRYPNFNAVRPSGGQIRIATTLIAADANLTEIISRASVSREEATRTLNALSACDAIVLGQSNAVTTLERAPPSTQRRGGLGTLLRNMRKHLGLRA